MAEHLTAFRKILFCMIGLTTTASVFESLLPNRPLFRTVRVGLGLWYVAALVSQISVILFGIGG